MLSSHDHVKRYHNHNPHSHHDTNGKHSATSGGGEEAPPILSTLNELNETAGLTPFFQIDLDLNNRHRIALIALIIFLSVFLLGMTLNLFLDPTRMLAKLVYWPRTLVTPSSTASSSTSSHQLKADVGVVNAPLPTTGHQSQLQFRPARRNNSLHFPAANQSDGSRSLVYEHRRVSTPSNRVSNVQEEEEELRDVQTEQSCRQQHDSNTSQYGACGGVSGDAASGQIASEPRVDKKMARSVSYDGEDDCEDNEPDEFHCELMVLSGASAASSPNATGGAAPTKTCYLPNNAAPGTKQPRKFMLQHQVKFSSINSEISIN